MVRFTPRSKTLSALKRGVSTAPKPAAKAPPTAPRTAIPSSIPSSTSAPQAGPNGSISSSRNSKTPTLKSLNAFAVSQASAGGNRHVPPKFGADTLDKEYRSRARKITLAMVAAPIAIVTSYYLGLRFFGGEGKKHLEVSDATESNA